STRDGLPLGPVGEGQKAMVIEESDETGGGKFHHFGGGGGPDGGAHGNYEIADESLSVIPLHQVLAHGHGQKDSLVEIPSGVLVEPVHVQKHPQKPKIQQIGPL